MLDNFKKLVENVEEKRQEEEKKGNPIFTNISQEPFWRPAGKERVCSSGARLGGYNSNTLEQLEKRLHTLDEEEESMRFQTGSMTDEEMKRRTEIWQEQQKILKKIREIRLKNSLIN